MPMSQETVALFPALSRNELAKTICEHLNWTTPKGDYRVSACLRMLESLEECGILSLPAKRNTASGPRRAIEHTERSDPGPQITCGLGRSGAAVAASGDGDGRGRRVERTG